MRFIPVAEPALIGNEKAYVIDCLESTWISSKGKYIDQFEQEFANVHDCDYAILSNSGTSSLQVALQTLSPAVS